MTRVERIETRVSIAPAQSPKTLEKDIVATVDVVKKINAETQPPDIPHLTGEAIKQHFRSLADGLRAMLEIEKRQHEEFVSGTERYIDNILKEGDAVAQETEERLLATKCRAEAITRGAARTNGASQ